MKNIFPHQKIINMNTNLKQQMFTVLNIGEFLTCTVTLVFSWQILAMDPRLNNYPALLGYVMSIFGLVSASTGLYGVLNTKASLLLIHCVITCIILGLTLPTIGAHVLLLAGKSTYQGKNILDDYQLYIATQKPWYYATQIILFSLLQFLFCLSAILSFNLFKIFEIRKCLNRKFETILSQEKMRHILYNRSNYEDIVQKV